LPHKQILGVFLAVLLISLISPDISKSSNGSVAYAELLPVKIDHDENGETWILPQKTWDGKNQYVYKTGGEAPPRIYDDGIIVSNDLVKSTNIEVDLSSNLSSEVIYKNGSDNLAKESWFVYRNDEKISWNSITDLGTQLINVPKIETVGSFTVTDYENQVKKERMLYNDFSSLWLEYKIHEGNPLKHTMNLTATSNGKFSICQELSDINYDEVRKIDEDNKTIETIDATIIKSENNDVSAIDELDLTKEQKDELKLQVKNDLPEVVEFRKDGNLVLGEITSGAKLDFNSFEFNSINKTAKFCYGEFDLKSGESIIIDPDTFSSNNPTEDAIVEDSPQSGTSCNNVGDVKDTSGVILRAYIRDSAISDRCARSYVEWSTSSISDSASITDTVFKFEVHDAGEANCDVNAMTTRPSTASASASWTDIGDGTNYVSSNWCMSAGTNKSLDLTASGDADLQNLLPSDWFAVGIKLTSETRGGLSIDMRMRSEEDGTATPKPTLEVTYTIPEVDVMVTVNHYRGNSTAITTCNVTLTNSSLSETKACNSSGLAGLFTGRSGNHNVTVVETTTNFNLNKTRNFTPTTNLIINATVVEVNCSQTGSATDIRLWYNQSNVHTITNMTRPTCNSANVIHWNGTFSPDGKTSMTGVTDVRVEIRNMTAYGKNGIVLYTNGVSKTLSYSGSVMTSSDITVGSGTGSSQLLKNYLLLDGRPAQPTGLSASDSSATQIDLSWTAGNSGVTSISGYKIFRSTNSGSTWSVLVANTGSTATSYSDTGLTAGQRYDYMIAGINTFGAGSNSTSANDTPSSGGGGSSSGGGGGGGGGGLTLGTTNLVEFSLLTKSINLDLGEVYENGKIEISWDDGKDLQVQSVIYDDQELQMVFIDVFPKILKGSGGTKSTGFLEYKIVVPPRSCTDTITTNCLTKNDYKITTNVEIVRDGQIQRKTIDTNVLIGQQLDPALIIVGLMVAVGTFGIVNFTRKANQTDQSPKQKQKELEKYLKTKTISKISKKFRF
jgi:hypothetical protein